MGGGGEHEGEGEREGEGEGEGERFVSSNVSQPDCTFITY